jgi:hypothetical protein
MKLYVCWGVFREPMHEHPCRAAHQALLANGHDPELIRVRGLGVGPRLLQWTTAGRREVKELSGQKVVPVLVTDEHEVIVESQAIVEWAETHPRKSKRVAPSSPPSSPTPTITRAVPLFSSRPRLIQAGLVIGGPVVFGALCGLLLGASKAAYLVATVLSIAGGFFAGFEHRSAREGAIRGAVGGSLFGSFIPIAHQIDGHRATAALPHPEILLVAITLAFGALLGAFGGHTRRRTESCAPAE